MVWKIRKSAVQFSSISGPFLSVDYFRRVFFPTSSIFECSYDAECRDDCYFYLYCTFIFTAIFFKEGDDEGVGYFYAAIPIDPICIAIYFFNASVSFNTRTVFFINDGTAVFIIIYSKNEWAGLGVCCRKGMCK